MPEVPEYLMKFPDRVSENLNHKTIFVTGGTGFLGKILIEKILRKSTKLERMFLLVRSKKGKEPKQRLDEMFAAPIFEILRNKCGPEVFDKVTAINGDMSEKGMGMSEEDRKLVRGCVQVVFHSAATIRFDEPLRKAVLLNTRGTREVLELAKGMEKLELFLHVSTAYCHLQEKVLEEKSYPPADNPHKVIKFCELLDEEIIDSVSKKILKDFPNSYAFTKNLSEGLVVEQMNNGMPCLIARPSVVIPVWLEPLPGWTDNINGPTGLLIGAGKGVIRTMYCDNTGYADYAPVDLAVNAILLAAWNYMSVKYVESNIFNLTTSADMKVTWQDVVDTGKDISLNEIPLNNVVWYPGGSMKRSKLLHQICVIFLHLIPALILDGIIYLSGNKPVLLRIQDRITKGFEVFEYYANNQWEFKNDNIKELRRIMNQREAIEYKIDGMGMDIRNYFRDCILAARLYILKEMPETIPAARRHLRMYVQLHFITYF
ncbi:hypothetical protein AAG570_006585 [Ranatra chinensis]|uniref:Fatty acyl-CoA reductase n=1 Tax=Ranatra chinensis TaxID=642074 RepID=A0ABD0ZBG5_9HEMI